jgi:hypothetical protein
MALLVKYWRTTPHSNLEFVATLLSAAASAIRTIAVPIQRPGWRAGIALIRSGGIVVFDSAPEVEIVARATPSRQLIAPLITGSVMAPACTPHFVRIFI